MKCWSAALLPVAFSLFSARAQAQSAGESSYFEARRAHVSISAGRRAATLQIMPKGSSDPIAECDNYCDFWALPGRYTLYTRDHETGEQHRLSLRIKDSARYTFDEGNGTTRALGGTLGIAGALSGVVGMFMVLSNLAVGDDPSASQTSAQRATTELGLGLLLGSAVATPLGWVMFGQSGAKLTELDNPNPAASGGPSLRLGVVGVNGGLGLGGLAVF